MPFNRGQWQLLHAPIWLFFLIACVALFWPPSQARAAAEQAMAMGTSTDKVTFSVLSQEDRSRYLKIFELQDAGRWPEADRLIKKLDNRSLLGRVLYQRYMHPTHYRSRYNELKKWMSSYADQPGANTIYQLALKRKPMRSSGPQLPKLGNRLTGYGTGDPDQTYRSSKSRTYKDRQQVAYLKKQIRRRAYKAQPKAAEAILKRKDLRRLFDQVELGMYQGRVAAAYFYAGHDVEAFRLAREGSKRARDHDSTPDWIAGLSAWGRKDYSAAIFHFEKLAYSTRVDHWLKAAAAFWAARSYWVSDPSGKAVELLTIAAQYPRTFYGLIASHTLGEMSPFNWQKPILIPAGFEHLKSIPAIQRALALTEVGLDDWAEKEIRIVYPRLSPRQQHLVMALAVHLNLPGLQLRLSRELLKQQGVFVDSALYPLPDWQPAGGFKLDRALLFAFMRQESGFNAEAKSPAGARGLMQLMPRTASFIGKDRGLRWSKKRKLYDPAYNMDLGQRYIRHLMEDSEVKSLFHLAVAYNGGPGNLRKWMRRMGHHADDPLLFIESIPARETRIYVERVLTNFWIYRKRQGQPTPSLNALIEGYWPKYDHQDSGVKVVLMQ